MHEQYKQGRIIQCAHCVSEATVAYATLICTFYYYYYYYCCCCCCCCYYYYYMRPHHIGCPPPGKRENCYAEVCH